MCGIAGGILKDARHDERELSEFAGQMAERLHHRGPDSNGVWTDATHGVALAHSRLAIVDLSAAGHQPMVSHDGRYVLVFNGEIYNHLEVRRELQAIGEAPPWRGHSDTESFAAAICAWGLEATLPRLRGMFAAAVWDRANHSLMLVRDRIGEKPLYYGWIGNDFVFASELKALRCHKSWKGEVDRAALTLYMRHGHVPQPYCIYEGINQLPAGSYLRLSARNLEAEVETYWSLSETIENAKRDPFLGSPEEAVSRLDELIGSAVEEQMVADVPHGAFLSGGIDSSTVVAIMQSRSSNPVRTFTIGFDDKTLDEAIYAKAVANHLGTEHEELYVGPSEARDVIPDLPQIYDEPFADQSQIPTRILSELTSNHVKVALSGDAGDELFGGYERYQQTLDLIGRIERVSSPTRQVLGNGVAAVPEGAWDLLLGSALTVMGKGAQKFRPGLKAHKWAGYLLEDRIHAYHQQMSICTFPDELVIGGREPETAYTAHSKRSENCSFLEQMMAIDSTSYLPDDILVKVDRAAMSVSLETRIPLLDPRIIHFAWQLPDAVKVRDGQAKWPLRRVLARYVPMELIDRPKQGFAVPVSDWLKGPCGRGRRSCSDRICFAIVACSVPGL